MKAARIQRFGPPDGITIEELPEPEPKPRQLLIRVKAAGVGNWDARIRLGKVELQPLPLVLGAELSGIVEAIPGRWFARPPASDARHGLASARLQILHQIRLLLRRKREALPGIVQLDDRIPRRCDAVVEVRRVPKEPTERRRAVLLDRAPD
jgi:hypothetical protein